MDLNLSQWLAKIEAIHPTEIELGLERVEMVARRMGLLQSMGNRKVITVAGTNGKGSCVATLEALLHGTTKACGAPLKFGSYTSPHFLSYNERIKLQGVDADDAQICEAFCAIDHARKDVSLSYFEFGTLAALYCFDREDIDVAILEVGLGGRLDAVNIVDADIGIVTSIALDHQDWLGSDLNVIGREKAGIYRPARPALCASADVPKSVSEYAHEIGADFISVGRDFTWESGKEGWRLTLSNGREILCSKEPNLPLPSVAAAAEALSQLGILAAEVFCATALENLTLQGRGQQVSIDGCQFVLDVAHNPAASKRLYETVRQRSPNVPLHIIFSIMADKDILGVLEPWVDVDAQFYLCPLVNNPRAAEPKYLYSQLTQLDLSGRCFDSVDVAVDAAIEASAKNDIVLVMGSFFTVAEALKAFDTKR